MCIPGVSTMYLLECQSVGWQPPPENSADRYTADSRFEGSSLDCQFLIIEKYRYILIGCKIMPFNASQSIGHLFYAGTNCGRVPNGSRAVWKVADKGPQPDAVGGDLKFDLFVDAAEESVHHSGAGDEDAVGIEDKTAVVDFDQRDGKQRLAASGKCKTVAADERRAG